MDPLHEILAAQMAKDAIAFVAMVWFLAVAFVLLAAAMGAL